MSEQKSVAQLAAETKAAFDQKHDAVKEVAEKALEMAQKGETASAAFKADMDEKLSAMNGMKAQLAELEQKLARGPGDGETEAKSLGQRFVENDEFKSLQAAPRKGASASMEVKADITTATTGAGGVGAAIQPNYRPGVLEQPRRRLTVRQLLMPGSTDSPIVDYTRETGFANNAGPVAEGGLKPQSDLTLEDVQTRTKVLAHWFRVSKQTLSDVAQIRTLIDTRLLYGLQLIEENQLLFGDGTGENLHGIVPQATAYANPMTGGDTQSIDRIRLMLLQASLAEYPSDGIVMNPIDWAWIELLKDTEGRYIIGQPQGTIGATLWNAPVVATQAMTVDKVLAGAFGMGAQIFDQWAGRIETGFQDDDFTRNKVTILAEERLALAVYRPEAFIFGDFGRVA
ncbi:phage major capsid protein [Mangrovicoccus algicola]|uniref:Phage major capsid protein n=1 Tax=Mangrovicoccus algicola TaxID=2771008 RepID=A0A8J7CJA1_9RHOB|nr:phage major capsid protein [Mangrovicoccus algicola]MBE3637471.1 phage major capsid protein [Mangrovicoccus algicola]